MRPNVIANATSRVVILSEAPQSGAESKDLRLFFFIGIWTFFLRGSIARMCLRLVIVAAASAQSLPAQQAKTPNPDSLKKADAAFRAGYTAQQAGHLEEARAQFSQVVRLAPQIAEGREALGVVLLELNKPSEAVPELEAAARLKPNDQAMETNLAYAFAQSGQPAKAIPHFEAATRLAAHPGQPALEPAFYDSYARALAAVGKRAEALEQFAAEEKMTGERADLADAIGTVQAQMGNWAEARQSFERALAADASYTRARVHLGVLYRQQNDLAASIDTLAAATRADPPSADAFLEYGR